MIDRRLARASSEVKWRKRVGDLEADIDNMMATGRYRHRAAARRHLLMDPQQKDIRKRYHRVARQTAKRYILEENTN